MKSKSALEVRESLKKLRRVAKPPDQCTFISMVDEATLEKDLDDSQPLAGITFAAKDNIDVLGLPTTAACPSWTTTPSENATVVSRLIKAGATCLGKTNMDQFATGLVGTRSPYGVPVNPLDAKLIPGGSSSGSAVAVASGLVDFALGTDTAGSGRVPAAHNGIVGLKPTRGLISTSGVLPAVRSIDCVSIFAKTIADAWKVLDYAKGYDATDPFSRQPPKTTLSLPIKRIGIPNKLEFDTEVDRAAWNRSLEALRDVEIVEVDISQMYEAAELLYNGPWPPQGLYFKKEVNSVADMGGIKFRSYNNATARMAELTKMLPVSIEAAEISQAFATGVAESMVSSGATGYDRKVWESLSHFYSVDAWLPRNYMLVNNDVWADVSDANKNVINACAAMAEYAGTWRAKEYTGFTLAGLAAGGMTVQPAGDQLMTDLRAVGATMSAEWLEDAGETGAAILDAYNAAQ